MSFGITMEELLNVLRTIVTIKFLPVFSVTIPVKQIFIYIYIYVAHSAFGIILLLQKILNIYANQNSIAVGGISRNVHDSRNTSARIFASASEICPSAGFFSGCEYIELKLWIGIGNISSALIWIMAKQVWIDIRRPLDFGTEWLSPSTTFGFVGHWLDSSHLRSVFSSIDVLSSYFSIVGRAVTNPTRHRESESDSN